MKIRPLHDRIVVRRLEEGEQRIGGIIIPDTAKEKPQQGKVIAAGEGKAGDAGKRLPLDVQRGDTILFGRYAGQEVKLAGEEYLIMKEDDVLAVIEREAPKPQSVKGKIENTITHKAPPKTEKRTAKKVAKKSKAITKSKVAPKGKKGKKRSR